MCKRVFLLFRISFRINALKKRTSKSVTVSTVWNLNYSYRMLPQATNTSWPSASALVWVDHLSLPKSMTNRYLRIPSIWIDGGKITRLSLLSYHRESFISRTLTPCKYNWLPEEWTVLHKDCFLITESEPSHWKN